MPPLMNVLRNSCAFVSRRMGLRHRYMFTKNNHLRLRYVAGMTAAMAVGLPTAVTFAPLPSFPVQFEIATAARAYNYVEADPAAIAAAGSATEDMAAHNHDMAEILSLASIPQFDAPPVPSSRIVTIESGDALGKVMQKEGVGGDEVHTIITSMKDKFDPRSLRVGQDIHMNFEPHESETGEAAYRLSNMKIELDPLKTLIVSRSTDGFESTVEEKEVKQLVEAKKAVIQTTIYGSAAKAGIPQTVVADAIKIFSHNVDFQRDVQTGDALEIMYETYKTDDGYVAKTGFIRYAKLTLGGREIPLYRYEMSDGGVDYFGPNGESTKKTLMRTPINGARLSSGYGMRRHPVMGYGRMHRGVDFAAPTGTPIYAAGDGVVQQAGRFGSFGNYVKIRHRGDLHTAYAHMSRVAVRNGARVKQGEVIGYVGTTGRSTGPHLHYEVMVNNQHVNPRSVNLPVGQELAGADLKRFKEHVRQVNREYASIGGASITVASRTGGKGDNVNN